jgi:hypothetical protein
MIWISQFPRGLVAFTFFFFYPLFCFSYSPPFFYSLSAFKSTAHKIGNTWYFELCNSPEEFLNSFKIAPIATIGPGMTTHTFRLDCDATPLGSPGKPRAAQAHAKGPAHHQIF